MERRPICVKFCDGNALTFDGEALNIDGEVLSRWEPVPDIFGFGTVPPEPVPDIFRIDYMTYLLCYQLIWSEQKCSSNLLW